MKKSFKALYSGGKISVEDSCLKETIWLSYYSMGVDFKFALTKDEANKLANFIGEVTYKEKINAKDYNYKTEI